MRIVLNEIYDTLERKGYNPSWNDADTGFTFNFGMELAVCHIEEKSMVVTFVVPCVYKEIEYRNPSEIIRERQMNCVKAVSRVNARNHVGRLVNIDGSAISAVSSFYVFDDDGVDSQTCFALEELERMINEFFEIKRDL